MIQNYTIFRPNKMISNLIFKFYYNRFKFDENTS